MSASDAFENDLALLLFNNTALALIGDAAGLQPSAAAGNLYVSLHTGDPGEAGDQTTNECDYTSYARVAVARSGAGWTVAGDNAANAAAVTFPACTGGDVDLATHFGIGTDSAGVGLLICSGALSANLSIGIGVTPEAAIGTIVGTIA